MPNSWYTIGYGCAASQSRNRSSMAPTITSGATFLSADKYPTRRLTISLTPPACHGDQGRVNKQEGLLLLEGTAFIDQDRAARLNSLRWKVWIRRGHKTTSPDIS